MVSLFDFCRTFTLLLVVACVVACHYSSEPELALQTYVHAVNGGRCDDALNLLSARTRHALDVLRVKPQNRGNPVPIEQYYCNQLSFENCKSGEMTLSDQQADTATVSMPCGRTQDSFLPGFTSPFLKYEPRTTELIREEGKWHVVEPFVIRMVEVRETEDRMRDAAMEEYKRRKAVVTSTPGAKEPPSSSAATPTAGNQNKPYVNNWAGFILN